MSPVEGLIDCAEPADMKGARGPTTRGPHRPRSAPETARETRTGKTLESGYNRESLVPTRDLEGETYA